MGGQISNITTEIVEVLNLDRNTVETLPGPGFYKHYYCKYFNNTKYFTKTVIYIIIFILKTFIFRWKRLEN